MLCVAQHMSNIHQQDEEAMHYSLTHTYVKRRHLKLSNVHQEGQANDLQQQQQLNNTLLMLTREETYQTFQPTKKRAI